MKQTMILEIIYVSPASKTEVKKNEKGTLEELIKIIKKYSVYQIIKLEMKEVK